jgi:hypothetical protein
LREILEKEDEEKLEEAFSQARGVRDDWLRGKE